LELVVGKSVSECGEGRTAGFRFNNSACSPPNVPMLSWIRKFGVHTSSRKDAAAMIGPPHTCGEICK